MAEIPNSISEEKFGLYVVSSSPVTETDLRIYFKNNGGEVDEQTLTDFLEKTDLITKDGINPATGEQKYVYTDKLSQKVYEMYGDFCV